jgi:uncharacterized protein YhaN
MKLSKLQIDGYGRFIEREFELAPGLQIIAGANEQGKSTTRHFIGDMLYGQKRNTTKRIYEESNELRMPWGNASTFGGRLTYILDNDHEIEVHRNFDRKNESLSVFNRTLGQDITNDFPVLKNRESTFPEVHLNMTKSVFIGTATISHVSLMELGDKEALVSIRERLLSLTDSGDESRSAEDALQWLNARSISIGQKTARTKPLPMTRARLLDLQDEYQMVLDARQEIQVVERQHTSIMEEIGILLNEKTALEIELAQCRNTEHGTRLSRATDLTNEINSCTRESMGIAQYRDFPIDLFAHVSQLQTQLAGAEEQLQKAENRLTEQQLELDATLERLANEGVVVMKEVNPEYESTLTSLEAEIQSLNYRINETEELHAQCQKGYMDAQQALGNLPDFSQFSTEPIERITQATAEFDLACKVRDEEQTQFEHIEETLEQKHSLSEESEKLFAKFDDFGKVLESHENSTTEHEEFLADLYHDSEDIKHRIDDIESRLPSFYIFTALSVFALIAVLVVVLSTQNTTFYYTAGIFGLLFAILGSMTLLSRNHLRREHKRLSTTEMEINRHEIANQRSTKQFEELMESTNSSTLREIEAIYDQFLNSQKDRDRYQEHLNLQQTRVDDSEAHVGELFTHLQTMFAEIGTQLSAEEAVSGAAMNSISQYHEYRETKRKSIEHRDSLNRYINELESLNTKRESLRADERKHSLYARQFMRDNHYEEESQHDSALSALRSYRIKSAQARHQQSDLEVVQGQIKVLKQQLDEHSQSTASLQAELEAALLEASSDSFEEYQDKYTNAKRYKELRAQRNQCEEQLAHVLGEDTLASLQERYGNVDVNESTTGRSADAIQAELSGIQQTLDDKRKREHALHILLAERSAGMRSLNEVEEERDATIARQADLELELQAAEHASQIMQEVTQKRHTKVAPKLAQLASEYLSIITDGAYKELLINQDMQISIRVPQTQALNQDPERLLSKGTVDQIYLSLRLAMINILSEGAEQIPMVLDDPFAHYDDARVKSAMKLMTEVAENNQVLLFTCREDVVRAAETLGAPVLHI